SEPRVRGAAARRGRRAIAPGTIPWVVVRGPFESSVVARPVPSTSSGALALRRADRLAHLRFQDLLHRFAHQLLDEVLVLLDPPRYVALGLSGDPNLRHRFGGRPRPPHHQSAPIGKKLRTSGYWPATPPARVETPVGTEARLSPPSRTYTCPRPSRMVRRAAVASPRCSSRRDRRRSCARPGSTTHGATSTPPRSGLP